MSAALLRVVHGGVQDSRLLPEKGQPNPKHFVKAFIRPGRFTTQWVRIDFDTRPVLGAAATITIPRKGQLLSRLYLVTTLPDIASAQKRAQAWCAANGKVFAGPTFGWTNSVGHAVLAEATIEIGGARVEQLDGRLLEVLDEFYTPLEKVSIMDRLLPRNSSNFTLEEFGGPATTAPTQVTTPLPFWFSCGDPGTFLPIDALQADPVRIKFTYQPVNAAYVSTAQRPIKGVNTSADNPVYQNLDVDPAVRTIFGDTRRSQGGEAYYPIPSCPFFYADPATGFPIPGLTGNPDEDTVVKTIPGITMPSAQDLTVLGDTYLMAEYVYLDRPEANRFRLADIQVPVLQHYSFEPVDTEGTDTANCYLKIPNPTRNLFFYCQRREAPYFNAPFLATRDLSGAGAPTVPWWPNASAISTRTYQELVPGFVFRNSEPINVINLIYEGKLFRYSTEAPVLFRSIVPSLEHKKSPWVNRYYYALPFGLQSGHLPPSLHCGEANLDKIVNINLQLGLAPYAGASGPGQVPRYDVRIWAETYNIFRVYGGRGGMMFAY